MTAALDRWPARHGAGPEADDLLVVLGLVSGAQVRGRLSRRGSDHLLDRLNNFSDPMLLLETAALAGPNRPRAVVARSELAWVYPVEATAGERWTPAVVPLRRPPSGAPPAAQAVLAHVGAFEIHGTPQVFHQVEWADFLLAGANEGRFFALTDAHLAGPGTDLHLPLLMVNAARVAALVTSD
jgi:hypothetical protein